MSLMGAAVWCLFIASMQVLCGAIRRVPWRFTRFHNLVPGRLTLGHLAFEGLERANLE